MLSHIYEKHFIVCLSQNEFIKSVLYYISRSIPSSYWNHISKMISSNRKICCIFYEYCYIFFNAWSWIKSWDISFSNTKTIKFIPSLLSTNSFTTQFYFIFNTLYIEDKTFNTYHNRPFLLTSIFYHKKNYRYTFYVTQIKLGKLCNT